MTDGWVSWGQIAWIWIASALAFALICLLDVWRIRRRKPLRDVTIGQDQARPETQIRLANFQTKAAKGLAEESKRARLSAATKAGTRP